MEAAGSNDVRRGALALLPGKTEVPLLVDHNDDRRIGTVHTLTRFEDTDGPWLACIAEIEDVPCWLRKNETKVSFSYKPAATSHDVFGCEISRRGYITEVSVLSPATVPAEPLAKVLTLHPTEQALTGRWADHVGPDRSRLHAAEDRGALSGDVADSPEDEVCARRERRAAPLSMGGRTFVLPHLLHPELPVAEPIERLTSFDLRLENQRGLDDCRLLLLNRQPDRLTGRSCRDRCENSHRGGDSDNDSGTLHRVLLPFVARHESNLEGVDPCVARVRDAANVTFVTRIGPVL